MKRVRNLCSDEWLGSVVAVTVARSRISVGKDIIKVVLSMLIQTINLGHGLSWS